MITNRFLRAMDIARAFPEAEVVGIDLAPVPIDPSDTPPNCRFEIDDINLGLEHFKDSYDVVHMRMVEMGLHNFRKTIDDGHRCLKPGGIALWGGVDYNIYMEDRHTYAIPALEEDEENPDQTERSWLQRLVSGKNFFDSGLTLTLTCFRAEKCAQYGRS